MRKTLAIIVLHILVFTFSTGIASAYSASGYEWLSGQVTYYVNNSFASSFITAMKTSDATWDAAGADFEFVYGGTTSRNPNVWAHTSDSYSSVGYYNNGNTGVQAEVTALASGSYMTEADATLNTYYGFTTTGAAGKYDVQDIMTHEFGHFLMLLDLSYAGSPSYCSSSAMSTMCGYSYPGMTYRRSLRTDDKDGIKSIYGT